MLMHHLDHLEFTSRFDQIRFSPYFHLVGALLEPWKEQQLGFCSGFNETLTSAVPIRVIRSCC